MFQSELGQSAGDGFDFPVGVWGSLQYSAFEDDFRATAYDADKFGAYAGMDVSPWDNMVFGVAFGYDRTELDTTFNRR